MKGRKKGRSHRKKGRSSVVRVRNERMREGRRCKGAEEGKNEGRKEWDIWKRSFCVEGMSEGVKWRK